MLQSGQYGLDTLSFKVIFECAVPTAIVVDYSRLRPLRSPWGSYDATGVLTSTNNGPALKAARKRSRSMGEHAANPGTPSGYESRQGAGWVAVGWSKGIRCVRSQRGKTIFELVLFLRKPFSFIS